VSPDGSKVFVTGQSGRGSSTVAYCAAAGTQLWAVSFAGSVGSLSVSPDGARVFVTGQSLGSDGFSDYATVATVAYDAAAGTELWLAQYNGPGNGADSATSLRVSPDWSSVFVTGSSCGSGCRYRPVNDYATVAYSTR
jgi:DNA-binding beta-propeller fold protein YncE